jgi:hypothetical protein
MADDEIKRFKIDNYECIGTEFPNTVQIPDHPDTKPETSGQRSGTSGHLVGLFNFTLRHQASNTFR